MLNSLFSKLKSNMRLLFPHTLINAFVSYDESGNVKSENWGDDLNYYFLREICSQPVLMYNALSLAYRLELKNYLVIGSTIDMLCKKNTEVWGAGIIYGEKQLTIKPGKVYAVRGPLTRKVLLQNHVPCPEVYGDPALLVARYYKPSIKKKYKYGIISHVSRLNLLRKMVVSGKCLEDFPDILLIDFSKYAQWTDIVDQILSCENILSSSLHGLILSEAYRIPNVWLEFGESLIGGHFKFHDFFLSINRDRKHPFVIADNEIILKDIDEELNLWKPGTIDLNPLIEACPFKLNSRLS